MSNSLQWYRLSLVYSAEVKKQNGRLFHSAASENTTSKVMFTIKVTFFIHIHLMKVVVYFATLSWSGKLFTFRWCFFFLDYGGRFTSSSITYLSFVDFKFRHGKMVRVCDFICERYLNKKKIIFLNGKVFKILLLVGSIIRKSWTPQQVKNASMSFLSF